MSIDISDESINAEMQTFEDVSPFPDANLTGREILFFNTPWEVEKRVPENLVQLSLMVQNVTAVQKRTHLL